MNQVFDISPAEPGDTGHIMAFIRELAEYERALEEVVATERDLSDALFCDNPRVFADICRLQGNPIGFALYFYSFSTWVGRHSLFLEDLYVTPEHRGCGAGKALFQHLARVAVSNNCGRFEWNVLNWNQPAIDFYESFGAQPQSEWLGYRLTGSALHHLAALHE